MEYGVKKVDANQSYNKYLVENYIAENLPGLNIFLEQNKRLVSKYSLISLNMLRKWENQMENVPCSNVKETFARRGSYVSFCVEPSTRYNVEIRTSKRETQNNAFNKFNVSDF